MPELPLGPSVAGAYANAAVHNTHEQPADAPLKSEKETHHANHSNVSVGFFDPAGVNHLGRTLSRMSADQNARTNAVRSVASSSNETAVDDTFSLEKTLRGMLKK